MKATNTLRRERDDLFVSAIVIWILKQIVTYFGSYCFSYEL